MPLTALVTIRKRSRGLSAPTVRRWAERMLACLDLSHAELLRRDEWIIDGFGGIRAAWERFSAADTLVLVDLPLINHYWWVTKRLILGLFVTPKGWPRDSPVWSSSLNSYRVIWSCHTRLTPKYRALIADSASSKRVHHLRSRAEIDAFIERVGRERSRSMGQG